MSFAIRRGTLDDLEVLLRIARESAEAPQWTEATYRELLTTVDSEPQRCLLVAVRSEGKSPDGVHGFAVAMLVLDEAELESVVVEQASRRRGVGRELCLAVMAWAQRGGARTMRLEVRSANAGAQALYRSLSFCAAGLRPGYYVDPTDDAVQMSTNLQAVDL